MVGDYDPIARQYLIQRLANLNGALGRLEALPLLTVDEADGMPTASLRAMVDLTADRVVTVARAMKGLL